MGLEIFYWERVVGKQHGIAGVLRDDFGGVRKFILEESRKRDGNRDGRQMKEFQLYPRV